MYTTKTGIAGAGPHATKVALVNYEFLSHEVVTTNQITKQTLDLHIGGHLARGSFCLIEGLRR